MITKEIFVDILALYRQGKSIRAIARENRISINTVRKYIRTPDLPHYAKREVRPGKLDPFKDYLKQRIEAAKPEWIPATVLLKEIRTQGYTGQISILRTYISQFKPKTKEEKPVRFETLPGQQLQIDFTTLKSGKKKYKAFVATLGYSRYCYVEFFPNEKVASWRQGIVNALNYFGGVSKELLFDNAKALVVQRDAYGEGEHKFNDMLLDLSKAYAFRLKPCKPYRAKTKGKVERFNHYLKHSFLIPLLTALRPTELAADVDLLNAKAKVWLNDEANCRIHGTTGKRPCDLFRHEIPQFMPLPALLPITAENNVQTGPALVSGKASAVQNLQPSPRIFDELLQRKESAA